MKKALDEYFGLTVRAPGVQFDGALTRKNLDTIHACMEETWGELFGTSVSVARRVTLVLSNAHCVVAALANGSIDRSFASDQGHLGQADRSDDDNDEVREDA